MKNLTKQIGIIALMAVIVFSMAVVGCDNGNDDNGGNNPQTVTFTGTAADGTTYILVVTGDTVYVLTVGNKTSSGEVTNKSGNTFTLKPSKVPSGTEPPTPAEPPAFTATVSGSGLTGMGGTITWSNGDTDPAPSQLTGGGNKTNWSKWENTDGTLTFSVDVDGVITVNVNKTSEMDTCGVSYPYPGEKNKTYKYKFEAWTGSGTREVRVLFGTIKRPSGSNYYPGQMITLNTTRNTFELECSTDETEGTWEDFKLGFNCGGEIGTIYVKIVSITKVDENPGTGGNMTWTAVSNTTFGTSTSSINAIAYGNNKFVAGGRDGKMAYSSDGITWTAVADSTFGTDTDGTSAIIAITYGNNKFVAVGSNNGGGTQTTKMAYSSDGINWTAVPNAFGTRRINAIAYGNDKFVAVGNTSMGSKMASYSSNGVTWTAVADNPFGTEASAIAYGNDKFVAGGRDGQGDKLAYSSDGITWTAVTDNAFITSGVNNYSYIYAIAYGNNKFVAGDDSGRMAYSSDGITWTAVADSTFGDYRINAITYGNAKFVAVGRNGKMAYSSDGITWTAVANSTFESSDYINAIAYGNNKFVAGGVSTVANYNGKMAYSTGN